MRAVDCSAWSGSRAGVGLARHDRIKFRNGERDGDMRRRVECFERRQRRRLDGGGEVSKYAGVVRSAKPAAKLIMTSASAIIASIRLSYMTESDSGGAVDAVGAASSARPAQNP